MADIDQPPHYVISNEHHLKILMEYFPRELDSINRLTSKSFNRVLIDINNDRKLITGYRLIEYLITNGMISLFDFVKESGCKFESKDLCNIAARNGQIDCLIHFRSNGYPCDKYAMLNAAKGGQLQVVRYLHEEIGCEWPDDICYHSAKGGNVDCLHYGHQHGCKRGDIATCATTNTGSSGRSPLAAASRGGHFQMVRELLDRGADINAMGNHGVNSLMIASQGGHIEVVRELLNRGANVDARLDYGMNSLMIASRGGHIDVVRELLNRGADVHAVDRQGRNVLDHAVRRIIRDELTRIGARPRSFLKRIFGKCLQCR